jgi:hypothetical protein
MKKINNISLQNPRRRERRKGKLNRNIHKKCDVFSKKC